MQKCLVKITTEIDGNVSEVSHTGGCIFRATSAEIVYKQDSSSNTIELKDKSLRITRTGDYTLDLHFKEGEMLKGILGIGGSNGEISTKTHRLTYTLSENSLLLSLQYALVVGNEPQETKVRLFVKTIQQTL